MITSPLVSAQNDKNPQAEFIRQDIVKPYAGPSLSGVDASTLNGKVVVGYQGWFAAEGDGSGMGWRHWAKKAKKPFEPGNVTVDMWPDVSEFDEDELYETGFRYNDGSAGKVFSSHNKKTVIRHFKWMEDYGIDGAFIQRFIWSMRNEDTEHHNNVVLASAREGANRHGRIYTVMYDITSTPDDELVERVQADWSKLRNEMKITEDPAYLHHNGRPLVVVWGIGFNNSIKQRNSLAKCEELIDMLKADGCSVMIGTPTGWLTQTRDALDDPDLLRVFKKVDVISPWTAGRYKSIEAAKEHAVDYWAPDIQWCNQNDVDYLPVIHPGFSWHNLKGGAFNAVPRLKGRYMWAQASEAVKAGAQAIYIGMFDEVDEGTAIFKVTNNPPTGNGGKLLDHEGLPSDFYLRLATGIGRMVRKEIPTDHDIIPFIQEMEALQARNAEK